MMGCCSWNLGSSCRDSIKTKRNRVQASPQRLTQAFPLQPTEALGRPRMWPTDKAQFLPTPTMSPFSPWHAPWAKTAAPSRIAAETPPTPHRFVPTKGTYYHCRKNEENGEVAGDKVPIPGKTLGSCSSRGRQRSGLSLLRGEETRARHNRRDPRAAFPPPKQYFKLQPEKMATFWYKII